MAHELEYVIDNALLDCSEGTVPQFFKVTPRNIRIQGLKVGNASDKVAFTNIPSFVICKKLSQQSGFPVPCVPVPQTWQETYPVQINKEELLVFRSCIKCSSGQGTIEFLSSGQTPVGAADLAQLQQLQKEAEEALAQAQAEQNAVGESGLVEGMIPLWGSGRDFVHSAQTGSVGGMLLNGGFFIWDAASVVAGVFSFGTATVAMQGAKAGVRGLIKAGVKVASKELAQKVAQLTAKALLAKQALAKALLKAASTRVCVIACFGAGTPVAVREGTKNIEDVVAGDWVWSRHERTGELALKRVVQTIQRASDHLVHLQVGGERIATTVEHPFWVKDQGWVKAGALRVGDLVQRADGAAVAVTEIEHQTEFGGDELPVVYNLEVAEWHTYLVGKWMWWVHNATVCLSKVLVKLGGKIVERVKGPFSLSAFNAASKGSAAELTKRMQKAMGLKKPKGHAAHHMVMKAPRSKWTSKKAKDALEESQDILKKHGIDIDDANNGVYLPHGTRNPPANYHNEIHTQKYAIKMRDRLKRADKVGGKDGVLNELEKIRSEMEKGTFKGHK